MPDHLFVTEEIESQPDCWRHAIDHARSHPDDFPRPGERVAVVGCGTSWFIAMAYASLREAAGQGVTDAFSGSEMPSGRDYDRVVAISRSGTTSEIITLLAENDSTPSVAITAVPETPISEVADRIVDLSFADESSVVQTRFATTTLTWLRAGLGEDLDPVVADGQAVLAEPVPQRWIDAEQVTFLGRGWTIGIAQEAALKMREASQSWTEAYPAMDYRHGPISIAEPGRLVWMFGPAPAGLADDVSATGAEWIDANLDAQADLIRAQRLAVARAKARGLDPDHPRHLTRSVVLEGVSA